MFLKINEMLIDTFTRDASLWAFHMPILICANLNISFAPNVNRGLGWLNELGSWIT